MAIDTNMKHGLYLCKVKGMMFCDHIVLKYDEYGWWRYFKDYFCHYEGWAGNDLEIIGEPKLIEEITEE